MKHYLFISYITGAGGVQCYVSAKAKHLEETGWHVIVFSPKTTEKCSIPDLSKYTSYEIYNLEYHPHILPSFLVRKTIKAIVSKVGVINKNDEIIIESWNSSSAMWGELLAARLNCRHIFWTANEYYRAKGQSYEEKIDFYEFKMDRGEILASIQSVNSLFEGYRHYTKGSFLEQRINENPIQDIVNEKVEKIESHDWNICYIGRSQKPYVPNIINGVRKFANNHRDKKIQLILVGDTGPIRSILDEIESHNLVITELGDQFPIPRILYSKVDVVIAGSGAARHSADEGALVITVDSVTFNSHGLLGYDTNSSITASQSDSKVLQLSFDEALERVLVEELWHKQINHWVKCPSVKECTELQFNIINKAEKSLVYYNLSKLLEGSVDFKILARIIYRHFKEVFN